MRALAVVLVLCACEGAQTIGLDAGPPDAVIAAPPADAAASPDAAITANDDAATPANDDATIPANDDAAAPANDDAAAPDAAAPLDAGGPDAGGPPACPSIGPSVATGTIAIGGLAELSGIATGVLNPDVYWTHNDNATDLYAIDRATHVQRARFRLTDASGTRYGAGDVEDIAIRTLPGGGAEIFLGDIGSGHPDNVLHIYRVTEPALPPMSMDVLLEAEVMDVIDGRIANAETLLVDPVDGTLVIVLKARRSFACVVGPYAANTTANPMCPVRLIGIEDPSGGDVSPDGRYVVVRNENLALVWIRPPGAPLAEAFNGMVCPFNTLATTTSGECNGEAIAFTRDGLGLVTASESANCPRANVHTYSFAP